MITLYSILNSDLVWLCNAPTVFQMLKAGSLACGAVRNKEACGSQGLLKVWEMAKRARSFLSAPDVDVLWLALPGLTPCKNRLSSRFFFSFCLSLCMYVSDSMCRFVLREGVEFPGAPVTGCEPSSDGHGNWTPVLWKVSKSLELLSHRYSPLPWSFKIELFCPVCCVLTGSFLAEMPLEPGPLSLQLLFSRVHL